MVGVQSPVARNPLGAGTDAPAPNGANERHWGRYPVLLPRWGDPRLAQSAVLLSLQVLGQTVLGFAVSVPQIAVCLATCALLEGAITFVRRRVLAWPASALLTGNGVALLLRDPATAAGDHWSTQRWWLFAGVAAVSLLSKHLVRVGGRHVFNPSNLGLVAAFLVLGADRADAQLLYWGPWRPGLAAAVALIVVGAALVGRRAGVWAVGVVYLSSLAAWLGLLSASGHCIVTDWSSAPLCGSAFWWRVAASPETLVFAGFMITDPRTVPGGRGARLGFAFAAAALAALFAAPQQTEFATKVAILGGLTAVSAAMGVARAVAGRRARRDLAVTAAPSPWSRRRSVLVVGAVLGTALAVPIAGAGARTVTLAPAADTEALPLPAWPAGVSPPTVGIAEDVAGWAPWFRRRDVELRASSVLTRLEEARLAAGAPPVVYLEVRALMVRVPASVQDAPEVGLAVTWRGQDGRERTDWYRTEPADDGIAIAGPAEPWTDPPPGG